MTIMLLNLCHSVRFPAKLFASDRAIQVFGGYAYTKEYPVERLYRDARITGIYEGTSEVMKMVISASILKWPGYVFKENHLFMKFLSHRVVPLPGSGQGKLDKYREPRPDLGKGLFLLIPSTRP
jgi:hypothetical protein